MTREEKINEISQTVAMANELIQKSRYELTKTEQKAVLYMVSKIKPFDEAGIEYDFSIKRFCEVCNLNKGGGIYYQYLKDMLVSLKTKVIIIPLEGKRKLITSWFNDAVISEDADIVKISFSKYLTPYLYELQCRYTSFFLENVLPMKSSYGIRLYEYLTSVKYKGRRHMLSIDELRERVGCEGKYNQFADVRIYILEPAMKDINQYTDMKISYQAYKTGKKYTHIEFTITSPDSWEATDRHLNRKEALDL